MSVEKKQFELPDDVSPVSTGNPRDLCVVSIPKMGKGTILGSFTETHNAIVFDLEKGGYEFVPARKVSIWEQDTSLAEAFTSYIKYRNALLANKGKYEYLIVDGLSDLDVLSEVGGTMRYMQSPTGKNFNRRDGKELEVGHADFRMVTSLPDGAGYKWTREWFMQQIEIFRQISPYRIYAAHVTDKYIKDSGKEEVVGSEISLTGKLKGIFASRVTSLAKLVADDNKRYLNFDVANDSIIAGSRLSRLSGKILISEREGDVVNTFWDNIYQ